MNFAVRSADKHGLVSRYSRVLEENGINHMYSSTFKTANLLVGALPGIPRNSLFDLDHTGLQGACESCSRSPQVVLTTISYCQLPILEKYWRSQIPSYIISFGQNTPLNLALYCPIPHHILFLSTCSYAHKTAL